MSAKKSRLTSMLVLMTGLMMALFFVQTISAQDTRGTIRGIVSDPNGASVVGATVSVIDVERAKTITITTNEDGFFQAPFLTAGKYQVTVEAPGFKKTVNDNVQLSINETKQVNLKLEVGQPVETVTVTTEAPPLQTENASLGQVVDARRIEELPLVHGDPYTLMGLSPGVAYTGSARLDRPFEPTHIIGFAIDGTRGNRSDLTIDGAPSTATANANEVIATYVPPTDIVAEFKVQTATFDAQFGNTEGGVTSISIKSGTNKLHGSAYYFAEPGSWAANDFFGNARSQPRPESKSDRFGFSINGPVYLPWIYNGKNKTFFLFGYEGIRDSRPRFDAGQTVWVPTAAMKSGDFSGQGINIYDPLTAVVSGTSYNRSQFAGNIIPANRISPIAIAVMNAMGAPKGPGLVGNIFDSTLTETTKPYDNYTFRVDQNIGDNNHLFVRGSYYDRSSLYNRYTDSPFVGVNFLFKSRQGVIDDVHTFNSTTFLNLRYGYNRFIRGQDQQEDARGIDLTSLGWGAAYNSLVPEEIRRFPRFDFNGALSNGMSNEFRPVDTHSFAAILNKIYGNHSMKIGSELRIYREDDNFQSNDQTGQFTFTNTYTRQNSATGTDLNGVQAFASFLLGLPSTQQIVRRADYSEYSKTYGFFVQDDWKVNRKLTVNLGLRYEMETPLIERQNKSVAGFDPTYEQSFAPSVRNRLTTNPVTGYDGVTNINPATFNVKGALYFATADAPGLYNTPKNTFLPRFGAAYQINDKTVIRGGFGLFAGFLGERRGDVIQNGYTQTTAVNTTSLGNGAIIPQNIALFPSLINIVEPTGNSRGALTGLGTAITYFNQNPKSSKQARFQVGIQRELKYGVVVEAVYVGNYGYDIEINRNINALPNIYLNADNYLSPAQTANNAFLGQQVQNPFFSIPAFQGNAFQANSTIARSQLLRPFPLFGDITTTVNDGKSWYHSGQFTANKRFSQGFTIQGAYTWSKWIQATEYLNAGDAEPTKMISDQDAPHRFSMSAMVELPFGKGHLFLSDANGIVDRIINGWQLGTVYTFQTGFPIPFGDVFYNGGEIRIPANERTTSKWFNTAVFSSTTPAGNHLRTLPPRFSSVRRDNQNNVDFSVIKDIRLREKMKIQIRFELINALNEPYFPNPIVTPNTTTTFGTITASNQDNYARRAQFGLKFLF